MRPCQHRHSREVGDTHCTAVIALMPLSQGIQSRKVVDVHEAIQRVPTNVSERAVFEKLSSARPHPHDLPLRQHNVELDCAVGVSGASVREGCRSRVNKACAQECYGVDRTPRSAPATTPGRRRLTRFYLREPRNSTRGAFFAKVCVCDLPSSQVYIFRSPPPPARSFMSSQTFGPAAPGIDRFVPSFRTSSSAGLVQDAAQPASTQRLHGRSLSHLTRRLVRGGAHKANCAWCQGDVAFLSKHDVFQDARD